MRHLEQQATFLSVSLRLCDNPSCRAFNPLLISVCVQVAFLSVG